MDLLSSTDAVFYVRQDFWAKHVANFILNEFPRVARQHHMSLEDAFRQVSPDRLRPLLVMMIPLNERIYPATNVTAAGD